MPDPEPRLAVVCRACEYPSSSYVAGKISGIDEEDEIFQLSLIRCEHCEAPSLVRQDERGNAMPVEVWPTSRRALHDSIPKGIRGGVTEARICFEAKAFKATAVMVRRAIEGLCADQGVSNRNLADSLQQLVDRGIIDVRLLDWANMLRILGNVGAHFTGQSVTKQDASDALDLVEAMLDYVYVFSAKFEEFKARRQPVGSPHRAGS
jgi:hypothetical protein